MDTIAVFVLGMNDFATRFSCKTIVPIPCLFSNERSGADFWKRSGEAIVSELWESNGHALFPSFIGSDFSQMNVYDQRKFFEAKNRAVRNVFPVSSRQEKQDFLFLETKDFEELSRGFTIIG